MDFLRIGPSTQFSHGVDDHVGNEVDDFLKGYALELPFIPEHLRGQINKVAGAESVWSTRQNDADKDPRGNFLNNVRNVVTTHGVENYGLFGVSGGYYVYYLVDGPLAFFYMNKIERLQGSDAKAKNDVARGRISAIQLTIKSMQEKLHKAQESKVTLPGERLIVVCRDYDEGTPGVRQGYVWLKEGDLDFQKLQWQQGRMFLNDAMQSIPQPLHSRAVQEH